MTKNKKNYDCLYEQWNDLKKKIHDKNEIITFYQGNIYFMSIGQNIGHESYGKSELFLRPVLVYKKLSKTTFIGIPLTSRNKEGSYYFSFNYKQNKTSTAMLNQMRVFDIRRSEYLSGKINKNIYRNLEYKVKEFMKITPSKRKGMPTRAKSNIIISNNLQNVKTPSILAIIPARGGSKRLPRKNILNLAGKPLIAYSIEASLNSRYIKKTIVSSDDDEILNIAKDYSSEIIKRPAHLATDTSTSFDSIEHTILNQDESFDYIILLQPTSPLRTSKHIDEAIELLIEKNADAVISTCEVDHPVKWNMSIDDTLDISSAIFSINTNRSQDQTKHYRLNGAIYIARTKKLLEEKTFFLTKNIYSYIMDKKDSVDIDDEYDFLIAEAFIKINHNLI
ncbi:MAG: type II toxin-antitoxin system PemK/MazF family toxin [Campylobacterota bacterium]|nr:type II toxin-antitoxin system PemK/MazF family toxin [Campylobacterota bacterium]